MSAFPSVGSTVTKVLANKSGTTAKVEFSDGTSLLVRYEALVIDSGDIDVSPSEPQSTHLSESKIRMKQQIAAMKSKQHSVSKVSKSSTQVLDESAYKQLAAQALKRQSDRQEKVFKSWENETGQHDHAAGPLP